jgi:hypothetical protein
VACTINLSALALAYSQLHAPRVMLLIVASLTDDSRGVIYNRNMFFVGMETPQGQKRAITGFTQTTFGGTSRI